jgi:acetylornithine deacetylase/succinyl-diaminopimelate desuccinylase-like protein
MKELLQMRMEGFRKSIQRFGSEMEKLEPGKSGVSGFKNRIVSEMEDLGFDSVEEDSLGTVYGIIRGIEPGEDMLLVTHIDSEPFCSVEQARKIRLSGTCKAGITSALYAAGAIKSALLPLRGDLIVCCVPRALFGTYAMEHFYEEVLKGRSSKIKGILLSEPTDNMINLGHKGRIEYEIVIRGQVAGKPVAQGGINMLSTLFPLVNELEKVGATLPQDTLLGRSSLKIKDISVSNETMGLGPQEFRVAVDRVFVPEENTGAILDRARTIASTVYAAHGDVAVSTALVGSPVKTALGEEKAVSEFKPWMMPSHHPFVVSSMESLKESGFQPEFGYWKNTFTEGSYTCAKLGLPTIGFGPGSEEGGSNGPQGREIERAALGQALIIHRNIGLPSFGWSTDEI